MAALHAVAQSPPFQGRVYFFKRPNAHGKRQNRPRCRHKKEMQRCERFSARAPWKHDYGVIAAFLANLCRPTALLPADAARLRSLPPAWHNNFSVPHRSRVWRPGDEMRIRTHSHLSPKTLAFPAIFLGNAFAVRHGKNETRIRLPEISIAAKEAAGERTLSGDYTVTVKWVEGRSKRHPHCLRANCCFLRFEWYIKANFWNARPERRCWATKEM